MGSYWIQLIVIKDLGALFDTGLKLHQHASEAAMNLANRVLAYSYEKRVH